MILLAFKDLGKRYLTVEPASMQIYTSLVMMPWSFKIVYGIISDNANKMAEFGLGRKNLILAMGAIQFISLISLFLFNFQSPMLTAALLALTSLGEAFTNVASQAMMVIQARRDEESGQQNLVTAMYVYTAVGGVLGCILGGYMTENYHPKWCFLLYSFSGLLVIYYTFFLSPESE